MRERNPRIIVSNATGWGHLGNAYGLAACFAFDPARGHGFIFLSGGTAFDPETERGAFSAQYRYEEMIATRLWSVTRAES